MDGVAGWWRLLVRCGADDMADGQRKGMGKGKGKGRWREMWMWMDGGMCRWWCGCMIDMCMADGEVDEEVGGKRIEVR